MRRFLGVLLAATLTVSVLPMILLAQTADYNSALAQAKADLSAGHNAEALAGSQKAIGIDPSRWEAYLVAGSALENQKQFDPAIDNYTKALERAPEAKKAGVRDLLEQCKKLTAASPGVSAPALTAQSPTFKETLDWLISKNGEEGIMWFVHFDSNVDEFSFHVDFSIPPDPTCWSGLTNDTRSPWKYPELVHPVLIDFSALAPNSIGVKRLDAHHLGVVGTYEGTITSPHDVYYQVTGLRGYVNGDTESPPRHEFDFQTNYRAPIYADQDLANRVAKALNHAIDVCGGKGKPEAF